MTKPLTGYEKEIAILHAEARLDAELIEQFKGEAHEYKQAIERVRELHKPIDGIGVRVCAVCIDDRMYWTEQIEYPCDTIKALDGEQ